MHKYYNFLSRHDYVFAILLLLGVAGLSLYPVFRFSYLSSPGADTFAHYFVLRSIIDDGFSVHTHVVENAHGYQGLLVLISSLLGTSIEKTYLVVSALALPISTAAVWLAARATFGKKVGIIALILFGYVSLQPWQTYTDGTIPNIVAAGILVPLIIFTLAARIHIRAKIPLLAVLVSLILITHHLTTIVVLSVSVVALLVLALHRLLNAPTVWQRLYPVAAVAAAVALLYRGFFHWEIFAASRNLALLFIQQSNHFPYVIFPAAKPGTEWTMFLFGQDMGGIVFQGGVVGALILLITVLRQRTLTSLHAAQLFLISWLLFYWYGATRDWTIEPSRLARDLAIPGSILASYVAVILYNHLKGKRFAQALLVVSLCLVALPPLNRRVGYAKVPAQTHFSQADDNAYTFLMTGDHEKNTTVVSSTFFWESISKIRHASKDFAILFVPAEGTPTAGAFLSQLPARPCVLLIQNREPVLAPVPTSNVYKDYLLDANYTVSQEFSDSQRSIVWMCLSNSTPE